MAMAFGHGVFRVIRGAAPQPPQIIYNSALSLKAVPAGGELRGC